MAKVPCDVRNINPSLSAVLCARESCRHTTSLNVATGHPWALCDCCAELKQSRRGLRAAETASAMSDAYAAGEPILPTPAAQRVMAHLGKQLPALFPEHAPDICG